MGGIFMVLVLFYKHFDFYDAYDNDKVMMIDAIHDMTKIDSIFFISMSKKIMTYFLNDIIDITCQHDSYILI